MLIVPEIETVFILVPRTSTGTLTRVVKETYPRSMLLYRHMEANGVPLGYDRWRRVGFVRHPMVRLYSLWSFMQVWGEKERVAGGPTNRERFPPEAERIAKQSDRPFEDWLLNNEQAWTTPNDLVTGAEYWPLLAKTDPAPENKRSQYSYLRPDLGTIIHKFEDISEAYAEYGLELDQHANARPDRELPTFSEEAWRHVENFCAWDIDQHCKYV